MLKFRPLFNHWDWTARAMGLSREPHAQDLPGLVMIQIDGFSRVELKTALEKNEMPFLKKLLAKEQYRLHPLYTGLPSTTPAVQGELFYGVKQCVPSFFFYDRQARKMFRMFDGDSVRAVEQRIASQGAGLLEGGSSYSNIFTGGAKEAHFCAVSLGWQHVWKDINPLNLVFLLLTHFVAVVRMAVLMTWEKFLAIMDFIYGLLKREDAIVEFKFIPLRVLLCILLRELVTLGAVMDATRGLPIIHLNYLGYDEQAHRRRPGSRTAHWALKGIDKAIARVYNAAVHSSRRHYEVWVYSDHGQAVTIPYVGYYGKSVEDEVNTVYHRLFREGKAPTKPVSVSSKPMKSGIQLQRGRYLGKWVDKFWHLNHASDVGHDDEIVTAAIGPLGGVYVLRDLSSKEKCLFAQELVKAAHIPLVLMPENFGKVRAWTENGEFILPEQANEVLDPSHPFFEDIVRDLLELCHHPNAGTLTISGWRKDAMPFSFPFENGAHAGPGVEETDAFALLPSDAVAMPRDRAYLKIADLRQAAFNILKGSRANNVEKKALLTAKTIRIMTYNVHSCIGMDGRLSPKRIARIIARHQPDIVALQELDMGRKRTGHMDQPHLIAKELEMVYHFHPAIQVEEEKYGNAILSRFPMDLVLAKQLPLFTDKLSLEPRGALWASVKIGDAQMQVINAHLSYFGPECRRQARALMSPQWVNHLQCAAPVILCGDFNCLPNSSPWRMINHRLRDAQQLLNDHRPLSTWSGRYPMGRIDHIFVSPGIKISSINVPRTQLDKMGSDHLPLIVDLEVIK